MTTKQKNNNHSLEEFRLGDPGFKTLGVLARTDKDSLIVLSTSMDIDKGVGQTPYEEKGWKRGLYLVSPGVVLALRKYNETHEDKVQYKVL